MLDAKPLFNADNAEEFFSSLFVSCRETANEIFKRDNDGRHASEQIYSADYQKFIGMQIAMREVLEYFSKFELIQPQKSNADRIRAMSDEALEDVIRAISLGYEPWCDHHCKMQGEDNCNICLKKWLQQPAERTPIHGGFEDKTESGLLDD